MAPVALAYRHRFYNRGIFRRVLRSESKVALFPSSLDGRARALHPQTQTLKHPNPNLKEPLDPPPCPRREPRTPSPPQRCHPALDCGLRRSPMDEAGDERLARMNHAANNQRELDGSGCSEEEAAAWMQRERRKVENFFGSGCSEREDATERRKWRL
ncbi:hypothetical protein LR48_Vigan11g127400 [Vigna angularis]|uniref:Uncharacterized protein n=1 Tax=Phaseolus angularis TaxID=3914 RepID=A0A0L9VT40_PHAAN|nr:hypothetical protein LR48_Vigan11g127400 [Vigna angularis]